MEIKQYHSRNNVEVTMTVDEADILVNLLDEFVRSRVAGKSEDEKIAEIEGMIDELELLSSLRSIANYDSRLERQQLQQPFRKVQGKHRVRKLKGERASFPKSWRHWHFRGKSSEAFDDFMSLRILEVETGEELNMLACTVRDANRNGTINDDTARRHIDELQRLNDEYGVNALKIKGIEHLV